MISRNQANFFAKQLKWSIFFLGFGFSVVARAGEVVLEQKDIQFWVGGKVIKTGDQISGKVGDNLRIMNTDKVTHNVFSLSEKFFFDGGAQKPRTEGGQDITVKMENAGLFDVGCAIHPSMAIKLKVD